MCPPAWTRLNSATAIACWPLASGQGPDAAVQRGHPLLEDVGGGIHQPGVDPAEFLQGEQVGGVFGALEDVAGGLMDRHRPRAGRGVGHLPGVQGQRSQLRVSSGGRGSLFGRSFTTELLTLTARQSVFKWRATPQLYDKQ